MGLGHESMGRWADGNGVNPMTLLPAVAEQPSGALVTLATRVSVEPTGVRYKLATIEGADDQNNRPITPAVALADLSAGLTEAEEGDHGGLRELMVGGATKCCSEGGISHFHGLIRIFQRR